MRSCCPPSLLREKKELYLAASGASFVPDGASHPKLKNMRMSGSFWAKDGGHGRKEFEPSRERKENPKSSQ
jgi:hypothetical protein